MSRVLRGRWDRARGDPAGTARAGMQAAGRRARLTWRRLRVRLGTTAVSPEALARALRVPAAELRPAAARVRQALRTRLPGGPDDAKAIVEALDRAPAARSALVASADRVVEHVFDLLGSGPTPLGPRIDWHRDFKSGYRWDPALFYADVPYGHVAGVDVKVPWELSRGQHLPLLAQAWLVTGDERYAQEAVAQIRDWLAANPPQLGVNWACPMDVAIRAVNWLWTAALLADAPAADDEFFVALLAGLLAHGRHVAANLEAQGEESTSNHYLADVVGLLYLGLVLPELHEAAVWRELGQRALIEEIDRQVLADGVDFESSIPYHRLVTEMFLSAAWLCRHHGVALPAAFEARLQRMVAFVAAYTKPSGLAPQVGDADDGRLHVLSGYGATDPRDHRHLLAVGAAFFERPDWWQAAGPAWLEALWFGTARDERWNRPAPTPPSLPGSAALPAAGFYILRRGADYVLFNAGPVGTRGVGNHKHNDLLALEVQLSGEDLIVDPGTGCYTADPTVRNAFRGTAAHATVMVDGEEQNRIPPDQLFALTLDARPQVIAWEPGPERDRVVAEHDGYTRLAAPVVHRREVRFDPGRGGLQIVDALTDPRGANAVHDLAWTFPFAPGVVVEPDAEGWRLRAGRVRARLTSPRRETGGAPLAVTVEVAEGWVSPRYGVRRPATLLRWRWRGALPLTARFDILRADR